MACTSSPTSAPSLPSGGSVRPQDGRELRATYYDTADLRLARMGITLRYRTGESGPPWHLKLPTGTTGVRDELAAAGPEDAVPAELTRLVTAWVRSAPLTPVATLRTARTAWLLVDAAGETLAEVVDDTVSILDDTKVVSRFREIEVERGPAEGSAELLERGRHPARSGRRHRWRVHPQGHARPRAPLGGRTRPHRAGPSPAA